jgi:hypothetical protein
MAAKASLSITQVPNPVDVTQQEFIVDGTVALTGSYPTNGDTLDLSQLNVPSDLVPNKVELWEATPASGAPASGYAFVFLPGTTQANGLMEMFNGTTQVTTQTYAALALPAAFVLRFRAWFSKFV